MAVFPALSHGFRDDRATGRLAQVSLRLLISLGLPVVVGTAIVGPQVVKLVYGWAFEPAGQILVVLSFSLLPMFISTLVCSFLIAADRQNIWAGVMGAACVINPLINLAAITVFERAYHNGALGAAYALLITDVLIATAALVLLPRELWAPVRAIGPALVRAAAAATIMGVLVWLLRDRFVLAPIAVGTIAFAVSALALKVFTPDDLQQGRRLVGQLRGRFSRRPITSPEPVPAPARTA
jgi:O-antigen/teichoic acid export membrane protein